MSSDHSISAATEEDLEELATLVNSAYRGESAQAGWTNEAHLLAGERINVKLLRAEMHAPGVTILCLRQEKKLVGCVSLSLKEEGEKICYLGMLTVSPARQNAKLGQ